MLQEGPENCLLYQLLHQPALSAGSSAYFIQNPKDKKDIKDIILQPLCFTGCRIFCFGTKFGHNVTKCQDHPEGAQHTQGCSGDSDNWHTAPPHWMGAKRKKEAPCLKAQRLF
jgi:hypothetical protein